MLKLIYRLYKRQLLDLLVADFFKEIPEDIKEPSIQIMAQYRVKLDKLFLYQAYLLQRRVPATPRQVDMIFGMLAQLKILRHMLDTTRPANNPFSDTGAKTSAQAQREREEEEKAQAYEKAMNGIDVFKKGAR